MARVFVSYSRKDIEFAKRLTAELQKSELDFWIDWEGIPPTVDWWKEIEKGIEEADVFLFLISPDSAKSKICGQEIDSAVKNGKRIIPIVVREIEWADTPPQLGHLNYIFFSRDDDFDTAVKKLMTAIQTDYEWAATHRRLQVKALEWERRNKENSFLLRGKDLQDAELQLATNSSKEPHPTDLQREYVFESRKAADRQRRITTGISIAAAIALAALAVFGFVQAGLATVNEREARRQAEVALARQLAAQSQIDDDSTRSLLLAVESAKTMAPSYIPSSYQSLILSLGPNAFDSIESDLSVTEVAISPDGRLAAIASENMIRAINISTKEVIFEYPLYAAVIQIQFSADGKALFASTGDFTAHVIHVDTGEKISTSLDNGFYSSIAVSPDGKYVGLTDEYSGSISIVDFFTGEELISYAHENGAITMLFTPDARFVISSGYDLRVVLTDIETGGVIFDWDVISPILKISISPTGQLIALGDASGGVYLIELTSGGELNPKSILQYQTPVTTLSFNNASSLLASASSDNIAYVWNVVSQEAYPLLGGDGSLSTLAFSLDDKWLAGSGDTAIRIWDFQNYRNDRIILNRGSGLVSSVKFSADGEYLVAARENQVEFWALNINGLIDLACSSAKRNMTFIEWQQYFPSSEKYRKTCEQYPIESELTATSTP